MAFENGVTRNPYHPRGKEVLPANFDTLKFKVDGKEIPTKNVQGAFPDVQTLLTFKRDKHGEVIHSDSATPETEAMHGDIEIIGNPKSCGCAMSKFRVAYWWNVELKG